jgi:perosamine synthetase
MIRVELGFQWYPPAETRLSKKTLLQAFRSDVPEFSKELSSYLGVQQCILGSSGRGLLAKLLRSLKKKNPGKNEVLIPGYTCYSVASSVVNAGLKIRLYDLNPATFSPEIKSLEENLSKNTLAVLAQHLFGIPAQIDNIQDLSSRLGVWLIEDAAQGLGGSIAGRPLGTTGDFGLFSFGRGKPLPLGSGGALTGKNMDILGRITLTEETGKGFIQIIKAAALQMLSQPVFYGILEQLPLGLGKTEFNPEFGRSQMPVYVNTLGALSLHGLGRLNEHRRSVAKVYSKLLMDIAVPLPELGIPVYTRFPVMAGINEISPELKRLGIRRMYPKAIADEPQIKPYLKGQAVFFPGARLIADKLITLPTHMGISNELAKRIALKVKKAYQC